MDKKELDQLYDRLYNLPESYRNFVLAGLYGKLSALAQDNDATAILLIEVIERNIEPWEARLNAR